MAGVTGRDLFWCEETVPKAGEPEAFNLRTPFGRYPASGSGGERRIQELNVQKQRRKPQSVDNECFSRRIDLQTKSDQKGRPAQQPRLRDN